MDGMTHNQEVGMFDAGTGGSSFPTEQPSPEMRLGALNATPTITERLRRERAQFAAKLAEVDVALQIVEANPAVQQVIDALAKLHWLP